MTVTEKVTALYDEKNAAFFRRLVPNIEPERVLGVKMPVLKKLAKELYGTREGEAFLKELPHTYLDENNLHAFLLMHMKDFDQCLSAVDGFLPYIDNWATCDSLRPLCFKKHLAELHIKSGEWMRSEHVYTIRFGLNMRLAHFLGEHFTPTDLTDAVAITNPDYYVRMMLAWYFATALAKQYDAAIPYIKNRLLDDWTHRKIIQKAIESYRITPEQKSYLKSLKSFDDNIFR